MKYRAGIDGLRALAVIPVILFHAGISTFSGGFVGVDVFFVISGFLITTIIINELAEDNFSIITFYERRSRRILPALFFVIFVSLPFAWFWLLPDDLISFAHSLIAVATFSSNFLFWQTSGYFAPSSELNPLLHTWSLAVEEQFYIFFPILLIFMWKWARKLIIPVLVVGFLISLIGAHFGSTIKPNATFYLLSTRGWELLMGSFCAFYLQNGRLPSNHRATNEFVSLLGLALLVLAIFAFDTGTPFPSFYALVPTLGTALIILYARQDTLVDRLLSWKPIVGLGLISYSAYLWHQPIFAFAKHRYLGELDDILFLGLSLVSIVLAYFTWKYVEAPFRNKSRVSRRQIFTFSLIGTIALITVGLLGHFNKGFDTRLTTDQRTFLNHFENATPEWNYFTKNDIPQAMRLQCDFYDLELYRDDNRTEVGRNAIADECYVANENKQFTLFIWGDSHAQHLYSGLHKTLPDSWQILQVASSGCRARLDVQANKNKYCEYSNWFAKKIISDTKPDVVIVAQASGHNPSRMIEISQYLKTQGVKKVIFPGPTPHWSTKLPNIVYRLWDDIPRYTYASIRRDILSLENTLRQNFKSSEDSKFVSLIDHFCTEQGCQIYFGDDVQKGITSWDYGHLTPIASHDLAKDLLSDEVLSVIKN